MRWIRYVRRMLFLYAAIYQQLPRSLPPFRINVINELA